MVNGLEMSGLPWFNGEGSQRLRNTGTLGWICHLRPLATLRESRRHSFHHDCEKSPGTLEEPCDCSFM